MHHLGLAPAVHPVCVNSDFLPIIHVLGQERDIKEFGKMVRNCKRASLLIILICLLALVVFVPGCGASGGSGKATSSPVKSSTAQPQGSAVSQENAEEPSTTNTGDYTPSESGTEPGANAEGEYLAEASVQAVQSVASQAQKWNSQQLRKIDEVIKKSGSKGYTFAVLGDNHRNYPVFRSILDKIRKGSALFAIECGDLGQTGSRESFKTYLDNVSSLHKPIMVGIGNHDLLPVGGRMSSANFKEVFGRTYYSFNLNRSKFIVLDDSNRKGLGSEQTKWLEAQLKKADDTRKFDHCFVFMHVPLLDPSHHGKGPGHGILNAANEKQMKDLFDRHHVSVIFTGHVHGWFEGDWGKTRYVITGGAGGTLGGSDRNHFFHHYIQVTIKPGQHPTWQVMKLSKATSSESVLVAVLATPAQRAHAGMMSNCS